jgi:hypothetical protein
MLSVMPLVKIAALILLLGVTGCASHRTNLVARSGSAPLPLPLKTVALMPHSSQSANEAGLERGLQTELGRRGVNFVTQNESDYTVAVGFEKNWVRDSNQPNYQHIVFGGGSTPSTVYSIPKDREPGVGTEGIRLRIYRTADLKQGSFQTAWEGFIDAGFTLKPEHHPEMLRILCDYLGRDFVGHVQTPK